MHILPLLLALSVARGADDPRVIVRQATLAVEGDSVAQFRKRWDARARRNPNDRPAILVLATLARLTYDYVNADKLYWQLLPSDSAQPDRYAAFAPGQHNQCSTQVVAAVVLASGTYVRRRGWRWR